MNVAFVLLLVVAQPDGPKEDPVAVVKRAAAAYKDGNHREAGQLFERAYELTNLPTQLRNAAKAYQDGQHWSEAVGAWERYRDVAPGPSERAEAEAQIALIQEKQAAEKARQEAEAAKKAAAEAEARARAAEAKPAPPPAPPPPVAPPPAIVTPPPPASSPPYGAYATMGVGAAALITAGVLFFHADSRLGTLDDQLGTTDGSGLIVGISRADANAELDAINTERNASAVVAGAGVALAAIGVVWWALSGDEPAEPGAVAVRF